MKYIICGFYGHNNIGDEMFIRAFTQLLHDDQLTFSELSKLDYDNLEEYDAVIVGAGDVMNDFYGLKYNEVLRNYHGYKIAVGVGFSFDACTKRDYINTFDDIMIRNMTDIVPVRKYLGTLHTHSVPDLGFSIPFNIIQTEKTGKKIGVFLVGSFIKNLSFMFSLLTLMNWLITLGYHIELIPMYTGTDLDDNDCTINDYIHRTFCHTGAITSHSPCSLESFYERLNYLDFAICARFHSHVFCTQAGIPFISLPVTRKDEIYIKELPDICRHSVKLFYDDNYNIIGFDVDNAKDQFLSVVNHSHSISQSLYKVSDERNKFFQCQKIQRLIHNRRKRVISSCLFSRIDPEQIYKKYLQAFLKKGINPFTDICDDKIWVEDLADNLCYEITQDPANDYIYGTRINLSEKPHNLRDIIYFIYHDNLSKITFPKLNINYIKQDSFRGLHRAGWQFATDSLYHLSDDYGIFLDTYIDRTFGWAATILKNSGILPYTNHWIGFIHHTFDTDFSPNNCERLFSSDLFIQSLPLCKGIFCLTQYLAQLVDKKIHELGFDIKVETLFHPTIFPSNLFSYDKFLNNPQKKLINIGSWYRNPNTIYSIANSYPPSNIICSSLRGKRMDNNFPPSNLSITKCDNLLQCETNNWTRYYIKYINSQSDPYSKDIFSKISLRSDVNNIDLRSFGPTNDDLLHDYINNVNVITTLDDNQYDLLLTENIVFLDLVDASVANTVIECIVRATPILINKIPPTIEMLGPDYPLFYDNISEIPSLLSNDNILRTHQYLLNRDSSVYRIENFTSSFVSSSIFNQIP